jgi:hypothetical protein
MTLHVGAPAMAVRSSIFGMGGDDEARAGPRTFVRGRAPHSNQDGTLRVYPAFQWSLFPCRSALACTGGCELLVVLVFVPLTYT